MILLQIAGLALFVRYIETTLLYSLFLRYFGRIKKNKKGADVVSIIKQVLCFFIDGTYFCLTQFDKLKGDKGYAEVIEERAESMCSSHTIKRFFGALHYYMAGNFRRILQKLFIWRLQIKKPEVIILGMERMVMDNNDAKEREGVSPTYKKVNGFQPLQLNWGYYFTDAVFREGSKHGNGGDTAKNMIKQAVVNIREHYSKEMPIIIRFDTGFFDEELFRFCDEELKIGFIAGGKLYKDIKEYLNDVVTEDDLKTYNGANNTWQYFEFEDRRKAWDEGIYYRVI